MTDPKPTTLSLGRQIQLLMQGLDGITDVQGSERYLKVVGWVKDLPLHARPDDLYAKIAKSFSTTPEKVKADVDPKQVMEDFESLVPKRGWLRDYIEYTRFTEPPTVFHFFTGATVLGATLKRNVHYNHGYANIYPNLRIILVAPSGRCRKTTACELAIRLFRDMGQHILADKITPEAIIDEFATETSTTGLIFAGELKQFLGSQKYMEGMIPLLTRLFDDPDNYRVRTVGKGEVILQNVCLAMLGASTMDWLRQLPADSFGGGFMSRFLLVVQESTPRRFPRPPDMDENLRIKLMNRMTELTHVRAQIRMTPNAEKWFDAWYMAKDDEQSDKQYAGYTERKPINMIRIAMILSVAEDDGYIIEIRHLTHALRILDWLENWLPSAFDQLAGNQVGDDHLRMIRQLKKEGGSMKYSDWLRRNSMRMKAAQFKDHVQTLRDARLVDLDQGVYYLTPEGWKQ